MDIVDLLKLAFPVLLSTGGIVYSWFSARTKARTEEIEEIRKDLLAQDRRIADMEGALQHLPDKESMHRLEMTVERLSGDLKVAVKSLESVDRVAQRIDTFLLENNRAAG